MRRPMSALWMVLISLASAADSQGGAWVGVAAELEATDALELELSEEVRQPLLPGGSTELLTDLSARYDLSDGIAVQGGYRFVAEPGTGDLGHRLALDLRLDHRVGLVKLKLRQRYTVGFADGSTHTLRTRVGAEAKLDKVRPYLAVEPFFRIEDGLGLHKVRLSAGVKLPTQGPNLELFTHFEQQTDGDRLLVAGFGATFGAKLERKPQETP